jgi:hypothetical protein
MTDCSPNMILWLRAILLLALAPGLVAQTPRIPRGIYAVVDTENLIILQQRILRLQPRNWTPISTLFTRIS